MTIPIAHVNNFRKPSDGMTNKLQSHDHRPHLQLFQEESTADFPLICYCAASHHGGESEYDGQRSGYDGYCGRDGAVACLNRLALCMFLLSGPHIRCVT